MMGIIGAIMPYRKILFGAVAVFLVASIAVFYINKNEATKERLLMQIATMQANEAIYKMQISAQNKAIDFLENERDRIQKEFEAVTEEFKSIEEQNFTFQERIQKLQLANRAIESPMATEIFINDMSVKLNRCFEIASGATLTEEERNAKNGEEFNSECPYLFDGRAGN